MPSFSPAILRLLEAIGIPYSKLAEHDSAFALGRADKRLPKVNHLNTIAERYSLPGRELRIRGINDIPGVSAGEGDMGDMYRIDVPTIGRREAERINTRTGKSTGLAHPQMDVIRNYYDDVEPPRYDIDATTASSAAPKGKGSAMQMYPAAWDLIGANGGVDISAALSNDNYIRKPAALLSYLLRGHDAKHVPISGEMLQGMDMDTYPAAKEMAHQFMGNTGDPRTYVLSVPKGDGPVSTAGDITRRSGELTRKQRVGALALAEAAKVRQRIGGMRQETQGKWADAQWPVEGNESFEDRFSPTIDAETRRFLGETHKIGNPTLRRALLSDFLMRRHLLGAELDETLPLLEGDQPRRFSKDLLYGAGAPVGASMMPDEGQVPAYAQGGLAQCHACDVPQYADGGAIDFDQGFNTILTPDEERAFQIWKQTAAPNDSGSDYDLRGAFKAQIQASIANGHWSDMYKKPSHPTFSDQSRYAKYGRPGSWVGDSYVPWKGAGYADGGQVDVPKKLRDLLDWLQWQRQTKQPGFLYGEGYMRDAEGQPVDIAGGNGEELRALVAGSHEPIRSVRQTNPMMGYHTHSGHMEGSNTPIYVHEPMSLDRVPKVQGDYWDRYHSKVPKMAAGGDVGRKAGQGYQPVRSTFGIVHDSSDQPVWSRDFNNSFDPHVRHVSESLPARPQMHALSQAVASTKDPVIQRLTRMVMSDSEHLPESATRFEPVMVKPPSAMPWDVQGDPMYDPYGDQDYDPDLHEALQILELLK